MPGRSPYTGSSDLLALGYAVREMRKRRGVPQQAVVFDAGVGDGYVSALELGRLNPSFVTLLRVARTLGFTLAELVDVYQRRLDVIDPDAGRDVPCCPTPGALEHVKRISAQNLAAYYATKARRARGRIKPWT
jgi:transcriptional regulator with XRE-family HTH domain